MPNQLRCWLLFLILSSVLAAQPARKLDIMFVGAHPDDDSTCTATLARYAAEGRRVGVVTATRGELGGNLVGAEEGPALGLLREGEERAALALLGVPTVHYLERTDSGFTTSLRVSEANWGRAESLARLTRLVRFYRPDVLITMSPAPRGHGDHQLVAQLTTEAYFKSALSGAEGLPGWAPRKLYYTLEYGTDGLKPDLVVPTERFGELERQALCLYQSQWPPELIKPSASESFVLAASRVPGVGLLDGLDQPPRLDSRMTPPPSLELQRTPALSRFLSWSRGLGLNLEVLAPATRVCRPGQRLVWPLQPRGEAVVQAPASTGPHNIAVRGLPATLQVVPQVKLDGGWSCWQSIHALWEGQNQGPEDASGRFRLRLKAESLLVEVEVRDDQLHSELPASENRAHWRTDALELAIDPSGRSQDTTTTFKLGVIIANQAGQPMAARDADAHPGPWQGPLHVQLLPGGYRVRLDIARRQLPARLAAEFGLNVLIYDQDRGQPACRLAWSAWETVQGWPELWGRVVQSGEK